MDISTNQWRSTGGQGVREDVDLNDFLDAKSLNALARFMQYGIGVGRILDWLYR